MIQYETLSQAIEYQFKDAALLVAACTHKSFGFNDNERLEFLGDAVLGLVISQEIYHLYPDAPEGTLSLMKSHLVSKKCLCIIAEEIHLAPYIQFSRKNTQKSPAVLANSLEAIFGAIFLDSKSLEITRDVILFLYRNLLENLQNENLKNPKNTLQERLQKSAHPLPIYEIKTIHGHQHDPVFVATCILENYNLLTEGEGKSKKLAEEQAASKMILELDKAGHD